MQAILLAACLVAAVTAATTTARTGRESTSSVYRPFPYLTSVRFANDECETESGFAGTCYTPTECSELKGLGHGECADGYGICCFMTYSCRETVHHNVSYFVPRSYPQQEDQANVCPLKVAFEPEICQIRLDFAKFDILGPREGDCLDDMFVVLGGNVNHKIPVLCGENSGHHVYINVDTVEGPIELQMITGIASYMRDWRIKISMIPCAARYQAPVGCLQYYEGIKGHIRSFNFNQSNSTRMGYLNGADYAICLRRERDMCSVTYAVGGEHDDVDLSQAVGDANDTTPYGAPEAVMRAPPREKSTKSTSGGQSSYGIAKPTSGHQADVGGKQTMAAQATSTTTGAHGGAPGVLTPGTQECSGDYLSIPGLDRFCGGTFSQTFGNLESQPITVKNSGPLMILFKSDKAFNGRGFDIAYHQGPCTPLVAQAFF